ncbi:DMT family transporter [Nitratireductor basaltis]|uniref:EamA domain-containing protein n=1 Tax=Nitratireductor basaltis TaxID=472175 RepID=A0A084U7L9_9HYPH|nr:DMT family transporter [Nitratireductor basaltis]KFB08955.1 hypothetical protein EL18_03211 [Nitratireductor basaltis]
MPSLTRFIPALFVLLWATGFIGARYAMPWAEPFTFLWIRFALSIGLLLVMVPFMKLKPMPPATALHAAFAGILMHGIYLGGVFWAVRRGLPAGLAGLIVGLQPMLTAIIAGLFIGEHITRRHWAGLAVGLLGVAIVLSPKLGDIGSGVTITTVSAGLAAVIAMSVGTVWQKRFVKGTDLVSTTLCQYVGGLVLTLPFAFLFESGRFVLTGELVFAMVWLVLVLSLGAIFLLMVLIEKGEVARVASLFYLVPAVTAVMAYVLFGETLTFAQIIGIGITSFGVALATLQPRPAARMAR